MSPSNKKGSRALSGPAECLINVALYRMRALAGVNGGEVFLLAFDKTVSRWAVVFKPQAA
jgi:hypothetical protein